MCRHIGETRMLDSGSAALSIVESHLRRRSATADSSCGEFAHFNLGAHFLDLRGLLFQLGRERLYSLLLLSSRSLELVLQPFHFAVLFEELVEQHRVD